MKKVLLMIRIATVTTLSLMVGCLLELGIDKAQANPSLPPFIAQMSDGIISTSIPTPTLSSRLKLVAPAFSIQALGKPVTLTVNHALHTGNTNHLHLIYRTTSQTHWRPIYAIHPTQAIQQITIPGTGEYTWVHLTPAAVPPPPDGAIVVDDVAPEFITHTNLTLGDWHTATTGGDYYGGHTHWSGMQCLRNRIGHMAI